MTIVPRALNARLQQRDRGFQWRGAEPSRIEGLSDAVFGFAITLLVVSLEVPETFAQLRETMSGFLSFALSFAVLAHVWYRQFLWFRRYGRDDGRSTLLNLILLFVVLFYVYPLKFLFRIPSVLLGLVPGHSASGEPMMTDAAWPQLMIVFGAGFAAVYLILALLQRHAWAQRDAMALDEVERALTDGDFRKDVIMVGVGAASVLFALLGQSLLAGLSYAAIFPLQHFANRRVAQQVRSAAD
jgi:hypothetical protein